jgi:hypothetical protein
MGIYSGGPQQFRNVTLSVTTLSAECFFPSLMLRVMMLSVITLNVIYVVRHYAEC